MEGATLKTLLRSATTSVKTSYEGENHGKNIEAEFSKLANSSAANIPAIYMLRFQSLAVLMGQ